MNLYYEIPESDDCKHWVQRNVRIRSGGEIVHYNDALMKLSNRVWEETNNTVRFVKYRNGIAPPVDMTEFMWIKLKSNAL